MKELLMILKKASFLLAVCIFFTSGQVYAQENGLSLKIQPSTIEERVDTGQVLEGELMVTNENGGRQTYYISTRNVIGMNDTGTPSFSDEHSDDPLEVATWIKPLLDSVTLDVGESIQVPYRIEIPENASPGSYFGAFFVTREAETVTQTGAGVGFHVASLVNLRVNGDANEDILFREFFTNKSFFTKPNVLFTARIDNTGTVHQRPRGFITIKDVFGNDVGSVTFNDNAGAILPRNDRVFETTWTSDSFALGRYTAIASVLYGDTGKKTVNKEVNFWVVPLRELGIVFGGIVFVLLAFMYGIKRYIRNALSRAGQNVNAETPSSKNISFARRLLRTITRLLVLIAVLFIGMIVFFS